MATTDTVLQPGAEDLDGFTGPAGPTGPQGVIGPSGAGADMNIMSINCRYYGIDFNTASLSASNFQATYILQNGTKFLANPHTFAVNVANTNTMITGVMSAFLVTPAAYGAQITRTKWLIQTLVPGFNQASQYNVEIQDRQNGSLTWRVVYQTTGGGVTLGAIAGSATSEIEFNLLITA